MQRVERWPARRVREFFGISDSTLTRWIRQGILPAPELLNGRRTWYRADCEAAQERLRAVPKRSFPPTIQ